MIAGVTRTAGIAARAEHVSYRFPSSGVDVLRDVSWEVEDGSVTLVVGPSGAGKTTLLRCLNGLVPHFHGGHFGGSVTVRGHDTRLAGPRELARTVGMVFQDPEAQIVTDRVEDEIVFGMENLGYDRRTMRVRLEETLDLLGIAHLRDREIATLSGGQRQRVAIAAALATRPEMLVLDEPTSQLDPLAAHDVLSAVERLNRDLGMTIVLSEHRLDRVLPFAERLVALGPGEFREGSVQTVLPSLDDVPPLVEFARALRWAPIPLTIRDARRQIPATDRSPEAQPRRSHGEKLLHVEGVGFGYADDVALRDVSFSGHAGEVIALIGRNGSGKTTLLKQIIGLLRPKRGRVLHRGQDIARRPVHEIARSTGYVPQHPSTILHHETVRAELEFTLRAQSKSADLHRVLDAIGIGDTIDRHPLDLSGGERQRAALAAITVAEPEILLLDEPTRGLPGADKRALSRFVRDYADTGRLVILATHDVELVAEVADRVLMLADGELVTDAPPDQVLAGSLAFGTQMNRLLGGSVLTLSDALGVLGSTR